MLFYPVYSECDCVSRLGRTRLRPADEPFVDYVVDRREPSGDTECRDESWTLSKAPRKHLGSQFRSEGQPSRGQRVRYDRICTVWARIDWPQPSTDSRHRSRKLSGA